MTRPRVKTDEALVRELAGKVTAPEAAKLLGLSIQHTRRVAKQLGVSWVAIAMPDDTPSEEFEKFILENPKVGIIKLSAMFRMGRNRVMRLAEKVRAKHGINGNLPSHIAAAPVPTDFSVRGREMTLNEAAKHYGVTPAVVGRWRRESGIRYLPYGKTFVVAQLPKNSVPKVASDSAAQAAHHIRRWFRNVHRADILEREDGTTWGELRGLPNKGKGLYYVDSMGVVPEADVIELARSRGWCREVW